MEFSPQISAIQAAQNKLAGHVAGISRVGLSNKADDDLAGNLVGAKIAKAEHSANIALIKKKDEALGTIIDLLG